MAVTNFGLEISTIPKQMGVYISSTECKTKTQYKITNKYFQNATIVV
jgi:hypothetical protein